MDCVLYSVPNLIAFTGFQPEPWLRAPLRFWTASCIFSLRTILGQNCVQSSCWLELSYIKSGLGLGSLLPAKLLFSETSFPHHRALSIGLLTWLLTESVILRKRPVRKQRAPQSLIQLRSDIPSLLLYVISFADNLGTVWQGNTQGYDCWEVGIVGDPLRAQNHTIFIFFF